MLAEVFQSLVRRDAAREGGAQQCGFEFCRHASTSKKSAKEPTSSLTSRHQIPLGEFLGLGLGRLKFLIQAPCEIVTGGQNDDLVGKLRVKFGDR